MAGYSRYSDHAEAIDDPEWKKYNELVKQDPDKFENWESLIRVTESLEGGLGRGSRHEVIFQARKVFDEFLAKFPLLFGYWKRYADFEFMVAGSDASEEIYQRAVTGIPNSVDLWSSYCGFKVETCPDEDEVRELFDTAAEFVGLDFLSHTFWDKYIEFEERMEKENLVLKVLAKIIHIPMHQYARYFERYTALGASYPVQDLVSETDLAKIEESLRAQFGSRKEGSDFERELRSRVHQYHVDVFSETQKETMSRWPFESEIKRSYFHVKPVEAKELNNWRSYLDFEESQGNYARIRFLYEKCLVATALYDEFWLRYVRWLYAQGPSHYEELRNIYRRASSLFVPIGRPMVRIEYATFEESCGCIDSARDIYDSILLEMPDNLETIIARGNMERRIAGLDKVLEYYKEILDSSKNDIYVRGAIVAESARLLWTIKGSELDARQMYLMNQEKCMDSKYFWINFLRFEIDLPTSSEREPERYSRISQVIQQIRTKARLAPPVVKDLCHIYMVYLLERGGPTAVQEYKKLDQEVNG
ncbi:uncharacterized protein V1516DRAFT_697545 [Lipomyces oligophaga]|uniref:uncharacterized protein n=1 Tax=Lipomyces oligophaga TaxID=45792 RepID=UPI0034CD99F5